MWQGGGGNRPDCHNYWPNWQSNTMAQSQYRGNMPNPWSYPPRPPPSQFSENDLFRDAYHSDRVNESFSFQRFDRPPPRRPSRWDQPPRNLNQHNFSNHLQVPPLPHHEGSVGHSNNNLHSAQSRREWEHGHAQNFLRETSQDKSMKYEPENLRQSDNNQGTHTALSDFQSEKEQSSKVKKNPLLPNPLKASDRRPLHSSVTARKIGKQILDTHEACNSSTNHNFNSARGSSTRVIQNRGGMARGGSHIGRPPLTNRWNNSKQSDFEIDDESNEINQWLQLTKGSEAVLERDQGSANKDPLPGSEEARSNAIKEATDRLKQALRQRKNMNLNELLSSGDESKSDPMVHCKTKSYPKNLAELQLDASDMRAIGRANTEKTNCGLDEDPDDDVIEVERPPTPVHLIIDLDTSPVKDSKLHRHGSSADCSTASRPLSQGDMPRVMIDCNQDYQERNVENQSNGQNQVNDVSHIPGSFKPLPKNDSGNTSEDLGSEDIPVTSKCSDVKNSSSSFKSSVGSPRSRKASVTECQTDVFLSPKLMNERERSDISHSNYTNNNECGADPKTPPRTSNPDKNGTPGGSCIGNDSIGAKNITVSPRRVMDSPRILENKAQNCLLEAQRRRRSSSSSSSTCEPLSPRTSLNGARTMRQPKCSSFDPGSPPFLSRTDHDCHQKKIISDLKKISQSKLKDLINNPRSGKLDCAMRELMKQHRGVLSRKSRDVAEKLIPAEHLNPKTSELPPDDSKFLADFAIDWSSLPGELISTLGDLFQDISSETEIVSSSLELQDPNEQYNLEDEIIVTSDTVEATIDQGDSDKTKQDCEDTEKMTDSAQSARIRVCRFARENVFSSEPLSDMPSLQNISENIDSLVSPTNLALTSSETNHSVNPVVTEHINMGTQTVQKPDQHYDSIPTADYLVTNRNTQEKCPDLIEKSDEKVLTGGIVHDTQQFQETFNQVNFENHNTVNISNCAENLLERIDSHASIKETEKKQSRVQKHKQKKGKKSKRKNKLVRLEERNWFENSSQERNLPSHSHTQNLVGTVSNGQKKAKKSKKTKELVRLEERNWFGNSSPERNQAGQSHTQSLEVKEVGTSSNGPNSSNSAPTNSDARSLTHVSTDNESSQDHNVIYNVVNGSSSVEEVPLQSIVPAEKQCLSMLPVLMMTVPANGVSGTVCNMAPAEMEKRIAEIDAELQNLVQERFMLSQSLKASQSLQESVNKDLVESSASLAKSLDESECPVESCETSSGSANSSAVTQCGKKSKNKCPDRAVRDVVKCVSHSVTSLKGGKRNKRQLEDISDRNREPKRKQQKVSPQKSSGSGSNAMSSGPVNPKGVENRKLPKNAELIVLEENEDDSQNILEANIMLVKNFLSNSPEYVCFSKASGNILDIKILDKNVFACSHEGQVYWFTRSGGEEPQAMFGQKSSIGVTCIEIIDMKYLYTGCANGTLGVFNIPTTLPQKQNVMPKSTHTVSNAIHCMTSQWGTLYLGTKAGCVIPFNLKKEVLGEPLSLGGYPVLVIKCCLEGPRKVLVVACRHQPISIRDATSGLLLRSFGGSDWTVYSIVLYKNLVYCGANTEKISVFDFQTGDFKQSLTAGKGVIDMRLYNDFLFSGCYDGKIYVHNVQTSLAVGSMEGPGNMVLCLSIGNKKIYCSSKDRGFGYFQMPKPFVRTTKSNQKRHS